MVKDYADDIDTLLVFVSIFLGLHVSHFLTHFRVEGGSVLGSAHCIRGRNIYPPSTGWRYHHESTTRIRILVPICNIYRPPPLEQHDYISLDVYFLHPFSICALDQRAILHQPRVQSRRRILWYIGQAVAPRVHAVELSARCST